MHKFWQKLFPAINRRMHRQGDLKKPLIFFPQVQMLPTVASLPVRWVCCWSKFSWDAGNFYLERYPAWLPLIFFHGGYFKCIVYMSYLEAQQQCQVGLRLGLMVSQRSCISGPFLSFLLPSCHRRRDWQCLFSNFSLLTCYIFQAESLS